MKNTIARLLLPACVICIQLLQITPSCLAEPCVEPYVEMEQGKFPFPLPVPTRLLSTPEEREKLLKANLPSMLGKKNEEILNLFGRHNHGLVVQINSPIMSYLISKGNDNHLQTDFHFDHGVVDEVSVKNVCLVEIH